MAKSRAPVNTPRVELSIPGLSGQALLDSLLAMFRSRTDRFTVQAGRKEDNLVTVEDRWANPPQWAICLEMINGKLLGYVAGAYDPDIGGEIYATEVRRTIFSWLSLFDAEDAAGARLRRVTPRS